MNYASFLRFLFFGLLFGFLLSRVGATEYDAIAEMFLLRDLHLAGVIGVAIFVASPMLFVLRKKKLACPDGCRYTLRPKARKAGLLVGSAIFGVGWALTGTCPGTGLAQIGEGKIIALFTVAGIFLGNYVYMRSGPAVERFLAREG